MVNYVEGTFEGHCPPLFFLLNDMKAVSSMSVMDASSPLPELIGALISWSSRSMSGNKQQRIDESLWRIFINPEQRGMRVKFNITNVDINQNFYSHVVPLHNSRLCVVPEKDAA